MALMTPAELLEHVETAITAITTGGQSYTIGSRSYTRADIEKLNKMRDSLRHEMTSPSAGGVNRTVCEL